MLRGLALPSAVLACLAVGCTSTTLASPVGERRFPPRPATHPVDVYIDPGMVEGLRSSVANDKYRTATLVDALALTKPAGAVPSGALVIGSVSGDGEEGTLWTSMLKAVQAKARALGGDGLVPHRWEYYVDGSSLRKRFEFEIVRYGE